MIYLCVQAISRGLTQAVGTALVGERLLELEARLPAEGSVCTTSFGVWQSWRRAVQRADSVNELVPQVRGAWYLLAPVHGQCTNSLHIFTS